MNTMINRITLGLHLERDLSHLLIMAVSLAASILSGKRHVNANGI